MQNKENMNVDLHEESSYEDGISLKELFTVVWNWKWVLIIITVVGLFIGGVIGYFSVKADSKVSTLVEFRWTGISKGEYPDGQRFDYGSTFNATTYGAVLDELDSELAVNELQKYVSITPIVPSNVLEVAEYALLQNVDYSFYPSSFKVTVNTGKLKISQEDGLKLLTTLIDTYRSEFERKYVQKSIILDFSAVDLSTYDYIDAYEILQGQTTLINSAVNKALPEGNDFISTELGIGFTDLSVRVSLLETVLLSNMESRINNYLLTKDAELLITIYEYSVEQFELELAEKTAVESELVNLIDTYIGGTSTIIIPGMDAGSEIDTEPYLKTLYQNLVSTQARIAALDQDIIFYNRRIDRLEGNDPTFILTPAKKAEETAKVETNIVEASTIISDIVSDTEILLAEYNQLISSGLIKMLVPPQTDNDTSLLLTAAIGLVLGGMVGVGVIFIIDNNVKKKKLVA